MCENAGKIDGQISKSIQLLGVGFTPNLQKGALPVHLAGGWGWIAPSSSKFLNALLI